MPERSEIRINEELAIPLSELRFRFSRSGGPGGQRANRTSTRVELLFDVRRSPTLSPRQRELVLERLAGYIDGEGVLRLISRSTRSQFRNRTEAIDRLQRLLARSVRASGERIPTRPTAASVERRLRGKRARSLSKRLRRRVDEWD